MGLLAVARAADKWVVVIIWDSASWHKGKNLRTWIRAYSQHAKVAGAPHWVHAKRRVCQPHGDLSPVELRHRLCTHFDTQPFYNAFIP